MLHSIFYVIVFLLALVISNVINKVFPKIALPLIQVVIGLILGFLGASEVLHVEPEFFLGFIIAPLLFREAEEADVKRIVKHGSLILMLIFPLVFATALGLGGLFHLLYVGIPLAACFALGASLAPTDAVAVGALSSRFEFPKRIMSVLQGEGLLNDASGIISFQIAVLALTTGEFSLPHATMSLAISAVGGAVIGFLLVMVKNLILRILEDVDAQDVSGYLVLEFIVPLAAFLLAEEFHVSGIIAVVIAGVMQANGFKRTTVFDAQVTKVKNTIWEMLTFMLNSVVFLFLGIELHELALPLILDHTYSTPWLVLMIVVLTIALFVLRFIMLTAFFFVRTLRRNQKFASYWDDILLLTFSGSKGTVSIATILLLPRLQDIAPSLLIFFVASVTATSFLTGMFVIPYFAAKKTDEVDNVAKIAILTEVVKELQDDLEKAEEKSGYHMAIDNYQDRVQRLIIEQESSNTSADFNDLQLLIIRIETEGLENALRNEQISMYTYRTYQRYIHRLEQNLAHNLVSSLRFALAVSGRTIQYVLTRILRLDFLRSTPSNLTIDTRSEITELYLNNTELVLQTLENLAEVYADQLIDFLQAERLRTAEHVARGDYIAGVVNRTAPTNLAEMMRAYYLERKVIFEYESAGQLTAAEAKQLRQTVNTLEDFSLASEHRSFIYDFLEFRRNKQKSAQ